MYLALQFREFTSCVILDGQLMQEVMLEQPFVERRFMYRLKYSKESNMMLRRTFGD
jgi:hypothetical protein